MPLGVSRSLSSTADTCLPPTLRTAYTSLSWRVPTNTVPLSPSAIDRAPGIPSAHTSTLKPAGTLSLLVGRSFDDFPVTSMANGCNVDSACAAGLPSCQDGGGGFSCDWAETANAAVTANAIALFMGALLCGTDIRTESAANRHAAVRECRARIGGATLCALANHEGTPMTWETPEFVGVKMDAEINSYQDDFGDDREPRV